MQLEVLPPFKASKLLCVPQKDGSNHGEGIRSVTGLVSFLKRLHRLARQPDGSRKSIIASKDVNDERSTNVSRLEDQLADIPVQAIKHGLRDHQHHQLFNVNLSNDATQSDEVRTDTVHAENEKFKTPLERAPITVLDLMVQVKDLRTMKSTGRNGKAKWDIGKKNFQ